MVEALVDKTKTRQSQVTHYFFDDCAYTTPLDNNAAKGKILDILDISTGKIVNNKFCGVDLNDEEIKNVTPKPFLQKNPYELVNRFTNLHYSNHKDIPKNFDAISYLKKNPDVLESSVDPYEHYISYGKSENRAI